MAEQTALSVLLLGFQSFLAEPRKKNSTNKMKIKYNLQNQTFKRTVFVEADKKQ